MNTLLRYIRNAAILLCCIAAAIVSWTYVGGAEARWHELRPNRGKSRTSSRPGTPHQQAGAAPQEGVATTCNDGLLDPGEDCDPLELQIRLNVPAAQAVCCTAECRFAAPGTVCRPEARTCDEPESCTGSSAFCPGEQLDDCCPAACGDTVLDPGEECDDGNTTSGDGCDNCGLNLCTPALVVDGIDDSALAFVEAECPTCPEAVRDTYDNHGSYVRCVVHATLTLRRQGHLSGADRSRIVQAAARSELGKDAVVP